MTYSIIRYLIVAVLAWLTAKGAISKDQADSNLPDIVNACVLFVTIASAVILSYLQKWYNGWLVKNPSTTTLTQLPPKSDSIDK